MACTNEPDESYDAFLASVSSDDPTFVADETGGSIAFKTEGGSVLLNVDCNADWEAVSDSPAWLTATANVSAGTLTIAADQNTEEKEKTATVIVQTTESGVRFATINITQTAYGATEISVETNAWHAPAVGTLSTEIAVTANAEWSAGKEDSADWLTIETTSEGITLTAAENSTTEERGTIVTVTAYDGISSANEIITVTQDPKADIVLGNESVLFYEAGETATVSVTANFDWDFSYDTSNGWFSATKSGSSLLFTATADNETESDLEGTVTITAGDGAENNTSCQISVKELCSIPDALIFSVNVSGDNVLTLPLSGTVNCMVEWGDGDTESITSAAPSHTYSEAGSYIVRIKGTVTGLSTENFSDGDKFITAVKQWGSTGLTSMDYAFQNCSALSSIPDDVPSFLTDISSFNSTFKGCSSLSSIPDGFFKNCTKVTSFANVFEGCSSIESIPEDLFSGCTAVTDITYAFADCASLKSIPGDLLKSFSLVINFDNIFSGCTSLTSIPSALFGIDNKASSNAVLKITFTSTFEGCTSLTSIAKDVFSLNMVVTDDSDDYTVTYDSTFKDCTSLTTLPGKLFTYNVKSTEIITEAFSGCTGLTELSDSLFLTTTNLKRCIGTFSGCTGLKTLPANLFQKCKKISYLTECFSGCTGLTELPSSLFDKQEDLTYVSKLFYNCTSLTGESPYTYCSDHKVNVHLYERYEHRKCDDLDLDGWPYNAGTFENCFTGCDGLTDIDAIKALDGWY